MSQGTGKISVRMSPTFRLAVEEYCDERGEKQGNVEKWNFTDFILQAIADKLNHIERSRKSGIKWKIVEVEGAARRLVKVYKGRVVCQQAATATVEEMADREPSAPIKEMDPEYYETVLDKRGMIL